MAIIKPMSVHRPAGKKVQLVGRVQKNHMKKGKGGGKGGAKGHHQNGKKHGHVDNRPRRQQGNQQAQIIRAKGHGKHRKGGKQHQQQKHQHHQQKHQQHQQQTHQQHQQQKHQQHQQHHKKKKGGFAARVMQKKQQQGNQQKHHKGYQQKHHKGGKDAWGLGEGQWVFVPEGADLSQMNFVGKNFGNKNGKGVQQHHLKQHHQQQLQHRNTAGGSQDAKGQLSAALNLLLSRMVTKEDCVYEVEVNDGKYTAELKVADLTTERSFKGKTCGNRKEAERSAAQKLLNCYTKEINDARAVADEAKKERAQAKREMLKEKFAEKKAAKTAAKEESTSEVKTEVKTE